MNQKSEKTGDPISQVPVLTEETWELLEYRMWAKFKAKLWSYVGVFLTISTLAGLFGVSAYIDKRVDEKVEGERKKLEEARAEFQLTSKKLVQQMRLLHYLTSEYMKDVNVFDRSIKDSQLSIHNLREQQQLSKNEYNVLAGILESIESFELAFFDYYLAIREVGYILNDIGYKKEQLNDQKLKPEDWKLLEEGLKKYEINGFMSALQMYPHLYSLVQVQNNIVFESLKNDLKKPVSRADLYQEYESVFTKKYLTEIDKFGLPFNYHQSFGKHGWSSISLSGKEAFILMELESKEAEK